jgi:hypothetical protein
VGLFNRPVDYTFGGGLVAVKTAGGLQEPVGPADNSWERRICPPERETHRDRQLQGDVARP